MKPIWKVVKLATVFVADAGWHYDDDATISKLASSLQRHGQVGRALVVRGDIEDDSMCVLVEGHKLLGAMISLGWTEAMATHVGPLDADAALRTALALELDFETDYGRMVQAVAGLLERGVPVAELAAGSPFDADRLKHFGTLSKLDWGVFGASTQQRALDWDALETEQLGSNLPEPLATAAEGAREAAQVVDITPPILPPPEAMHGYADQFGGADYPPLEDVTAPAAPQAAPAAPEPAVPAPAEPAAAPQGEPETQPGKAAKAKAAKPPKVPKAPDAQLGLF